MTQQTLELAKQHHAAERLAEAAALYRQVLTARPDDAQVLHLLGIVTHQLGDTEQSLALLRQAVALDPSAADFHCNLGLVLAAMGRLDEAIGQYEQALKLKGDYPEAWKDLADALHAQGRTEQAIDAYRRALALRPDHADAHNKLGVALVSANRWGQSIDAFRKAVTLRPDFAQAYSNLGVSLQVKGELEEAIAAFAKAIALQPKDAAAHNGLAVALQAAGRLPEAIDEFRKAVALAPRGASFHSNLVYALLYHPDYDAGAILQEHRKWDQLYAQPLRSEILPHRHDRSLNRRLRIGYLSPCFRIHCQSFFTIPFFSHHDHQQFEIYCYAHVPRPDKLSGRIRGYADTWRSIVDLSDEQVANLIRQDQIDILVDLTMHMAHGRPLVFARKPAPVQVAWLAYPGTTGMTAMDYRLTDPYLDPPDADGDYVEKSIRLPDTFWCYDPLTDQPPVNALPALSVGHVTFGCLNNFCKVNAGTLELWSQVLSAVPGSRLILLCPQGSHRQAVLEKLKVQADRVEFVEFAPRDQYLKRYHRIDIGLDTFPYNGHTTSLDSLWMGVPVVSMVGQRAVSRAGWSQSKNLGLAEELVGQRPQDFVSLAVGLAGDLPRLSQMRGELRQRMEKSPLMDAERFTRNMESAYRAMWRQWCGGGGEATTSCL